MMEFIAFTALSEVQQKKVWNIYEYSFPSHEKRDFAHQQNAMGDKRFHPDGVVEGGQVIGFVFYWLFSEYAYIEHFAIDQSKRGKNYGTRILTAFCEKYASVLLEIDPPEDTVSKNREHFYHRLGFLTSEFSYTHPSYGAEYVPHTLLMMSCPNVLDEKTFLLFKQRMFQDLLQYSGQNKNGCYN